MTREEAKREIDFLDYYLQNHTDDYGEESHMAMMMAIQALEQESCEDWYDVPSDEMTLEQARQAIKDLRKKLVEHLEQEPQTGHWFVDERPESDREIICSNCEQPILKYHKLDFDYRPKYCPNCGCRMVESQERSE